jgi:hypothetical protein
MAGIELSEETIEQMADGTAKKYWCGQHIPTKLTPRTRVLFEQAKRDGFVSHRAGGPVVSLYWEWCELKRLPVVEINPRRKYATVSCDMIVCDWKLNRQAMNYVAGLRGWGWYREGKECNVCYTMVERVPKAEAEAVARRLYSLATACKPATPEAADAAS